MTNEEIKHYGVPGMKWGRRKARGGSSRPSSSDHIESRELKAKKNRELTTKELKTLNNRLQLERTRKDLDPNKILAGQRRIQMALGLVGTATAVYAAANSPLGRKVKSVIQDRLGK